MEIVVRGKLNNIFKRPDFVNKDTGETKPGKFQLEFVTQKELTKGAGYQTVVEHISIPDDVYPSYKDKIGKDIEVSVNAIASKGKVIFYGV